MGLAPMVQDNNAQYTTNFTVSIEAAEGNTVFLRLSRGDQLTAGERCKKRLTLFNLVTSSR